MPARTSLYIRFVFLIASTASASILLFSGCGSDRAGDEIGTIRGNQFPEKYTVRNSDVFTVAGLNGPEDQSAFEVQQKTSWKNYEAGSVSRIAILLTDTASSWLGLAHGLKTIGVPFIITDNYQRALQHKVVLVYPIISGANLSAEALQALAAFPRNGGTLIGTQVLGALNEVFGFTEATPSRQHFEIVINNDSSEIAKEFTDPKEVRLSLGDKERFKETIGTYSYTKNILPPVATYEDKSTAISRRYYEKGKAYALGFDIGYMILKGQNVRHEHWNRSDANDFEPGMDILLRLLKNIYLDDEPDAAYVCTVPYNKELSVVLTHNINYKNALNKSLELAKLEKAAGIRSSYFIQTKYINDRQKAIFSSAADFEKIGELAAAGMDIQSNTVSGSYYFDQFEQGSGTEVYPSYKPYALAFEKTYAGTIFGEMRVSRFLIDKYAKTTNALAFRSSYQYTPFTYPQSLLSSGYRFGSTIPANMALTHFPVQLTYNREYDQEIEAFEFPITDDDELPPFDVSTRSNQAIQLANRIARYGGCYIGQVHPSQKGWQVEKEFIAKLKNRAWFGSLGDFGLWWTARNAVTIDVRRDGDKRVVMVNVPKRMEGLALMMPLRSTPVAVEGGGAHSIDGKLIIFEIAEGPIKITLDN
ncbi:MAG: hypothetical protein RIQ47_1355 [Bacteroidota bacterium]|jgi:hypothetical protein